MVVNSLQALKAEFPIIVTEFGILMVVSPLQSWKAEFSIVITELGILYSPFFPSGHLIIVCCDLSKSTPS